MKDTQRNKIWLKLQFGLAACILVAVVLLFALSGGANAVSISWEFNNTPQTVGPTEPIDIMATVTSDGVGSFPIIATGFQAISINNGNLTDPDGPYTIALNGNPFDPWFSAYGGSATFLFGALTPVRGVAPPARSILVLGM